MRVIIQPTLPNWPNAECVASLAAAIEEDVKAPVVVAKGEPLTGHAVSPWETLAVWLTWTHENIDTVAAYTAVATPAIASIVKAVSRWVRSRQERDPRTGKRVDIYGPDGRVIKSIWVERNSTDLVEEDGSPGDPPISPPRI